MTTLEAPEQRSSPKESMDATRQSLGAPPLIKREINESQICILTFDRPNSAANIFDQHTLVELNEHISFLAGNPQLKGVVLASGKSSIFIAGADLNSLSQADGPEERRILIDMGQTVFDRLDALPMPTVAAIHGACVGGGYELALACDWRIASPEKVTKVGLPETQLGILPAWGGSTRLPRLIGLPKALDVILAGKTLAAKPALKAGMVDELVPKEYLVEAACRRILKEGRRLGANRKSLKLFLFNNPLTTRFIKNRAEQELNRKTRGHYPAPIRALQIITEGLNKKVSDSLALEREAIIHLSETEACKNLIRIFFLQERAKKLNVLPPAEHDAKPRPVKRAAVIGAGVMGAGIAQWCTAKDIHVVLRDINTEAVARGVATVQKLYSDGAKRHAFTPVEARAGLDRLYPSATDVPLKSTDVVIEAAVEKMELKKEIFRRLDELAGPETILATNTSALSVSELAQTTKHPERVVGIHFFNPVHRMQLVEVVVGKQTSPVVTQRAVKFVQQLGKLPVVVKDSPGFLVNRILMPYLIEAGHLFETGARVEDIDEAMLDFGMPMGPLRLIDEVGVDVSNHVAETIAKHFSPRLRTPAVLGKMMGAKLLGKKSGLGFYKHVKGAKDPEVNIEIDKFKDGTSSANLSREQLRTRMVVLMINEAARCLEEGIVSDPADVDFAMIMGTGFAPFLGGPLRFADFIGVAKATNEMSKLSANGESRFVPCGLLLDMSKNNKKFYPQKGI